MTKKATALRDKKSFRHYLVPEYLTICNDAIITADQSVSLVRLIDQIAAFAYPVPLARFVVVAELWRNHELSMEEFTSAQLAIKLILVNPKGEETELGENSLTFSPLTPWSTTRSIFDLSGRIALKQPGLYTLKLLGKIGAAEYEEVISKKLPTTLVTGIPGFYSAQFTNDEDAAAADKKGSGFVLLSVDGQIQGGDDGYDYRGNYQIDKDQISANISVRRRGQLAQSVFGNLDRFGLKVEGKVRGDTISLHGHRTDATDQTLTLTLIKQTVLPGAAT